MVSVDHKTGRIEHLFVSGNARGKGIGQKMLDFARKKLEEYEHPRLSVLDTNARALLSIVGWDGNSQAKKTWNLTLWNILLL